MFENRSISSQVQEFAALLHRPADAEAMVSGSSSYPEITGTVRFYQSSSGVLVIAEISGLPETSAEFPDGIFAFHIHEGNRCSGNAQDPFADAKTHYNPDGRMHPEHAGDMPPLFGNKGYAFQMFLTDRFQVSEVLGRTVIVHASPDDFTSQPAGNSGMKIACGVIHRTAHPINSGHRPMSSRPSY